MEEHNTAHTQIERKSIVAHHGAKWLRSKYASPILAFISFAESMFAPIIIDPFLIALIMASPKKWKWYVLLSATASVLGGIFAYVLGFLFFDTIGIRFVEFYNLEEQFASISSSLNANGFVFVLIGAFTPIPYKIIALASGFLHIHILTFIVASIFGRFLRLGLVGFAAHAIGPKALPVMQRHLHLIAAVVAVIFIGYILVQVFL
jgi:membrane protein YqaA with SNARE-associated domain